MKSVTNLLDEYNSLTSPGAKAPQFSCYPSLFWIGVPDPWDKLKR